MIHNPENVKPYDALWAVLSVDSKGREGICAINTPIGPQVAVTGEKRLLAMYVEQIRMGLNEAMIADKKIVLAEFSRTGTKAIDSDMESNKGSR